MIKVAPSILSADFSAMGDAVKKMEIWNADWVHFDVMDGNFVPNITFGPPMCKALRSKTNLPLDVHLMVDHPGDWIQAFADSGADIITFHVEAERHIHRTLQLIHNAGKKGGVVLNPATPLYACEEILPYCDLVLLMSVNPGFGGQKFIPETIQKIKRLRQIAYDRHLSLDIEVDGGINPDTAAQCIAAGATVLVAGSAVFHAADPSDMIHQLRCEH